jgi:predicted transcriptional regulator of viral defense system
MSEALTAGISRRTLYAMRDAGILRQLSRGVYRLASMPELQAPDLVTVATRVPSGVVCLISALAFHELTTQIPHAVDVALARGTEKPRIDYPPVNFHWFSDAAFTSGIETPVVDGNTIRIYSAEKSVADAFKYRNKIGTDVALEALKKWRTRRAAPIERLVEQARICRVERVMRPYLEATT